MNYPPPSSEPIALVGSSCRFAGGVKSPQELGKLLSNPPDLSRPVSSSRFSATGFYHQDAEYHGTTNCVRGYWLEQDHRAFDAAFFNIPPKEAEAMDPQHRMLLEVVYEALESAGYSLQKYGGTNVAVYAGAMTNDYDILSTRDELHASQYTATGNARSMISNRLSYFFDFHGPSMTIDTACSSSLVALHQGVQSVRSGESVMACVAGVSIMLTPEQFMAESNLHMLSPTGHCRMWDADANGYARGEGVAACFIKTLSRALADGDHIQAIIRETGVNSDGRTRGITMPSVAAQRDLIRSTYLKSGLNPTDPRHRPQFFEAHGTGTPVGDPVEARAISEAFFGGDAAWSKSDQAENYVESPLFVGSVKTVLGHSEGAAGLAGVMKVIQSMNHETVFPNLHHETLHSDLLRFEGILKVPTRKESWPLPKGQPRRASVNSFGFGGTNSHAIIEQYNPDIHDVCAQHLSPTLPPNAPQSICTPPIAKVSSHPSLILPLLFSAHNETSLLSTLQRYSELCSDDYRSSYQQLCWHLYAHRTAHRIRVAIVTNDRNEAHKAIKSMIASTAQHSISLRCGELSVGVCAQQYCGSPKILGVFTGQGAQYATMSSGLFQTSSIYRDTIKDLNDILQSCPNPPGWSIQEMLLASKEVSQIGRAEISQPLCTALQIGLVEFLKSVGIGFHCVLGHSSGEIGAAYAAGRLSQRDAMLIAYYRGRSAHLASGVGGQKGGMLACGLKKEEAEKFCSRPSYNGRICVAASNSPILVTLSGDLDALKIASNELRSQGTFTRELSIDTAYHSFHMHPVVENYVSALAGCGITSRRAKSNTYWVSSVTGISKTEFDGDLETQYWADNMVGPVLFHEATTFAMEKYGPFHCVIEVGPHTALKTSVRETMKDQGYHPIPYAGVLDRTKSDSLAIADLIATMWTNFEPPLIDMRRYIENSPVPQLGKSWLEDAPYYAWDHSKTYWRESRLSEQYHFRRRPPHELLGVRTRDDNHHAMRWRNILKLEKLSWLEGHKFQGQPLLPASAYCIMALDAARDILDEIGRIAALVELQDLEFLNGITVEPESMGVETLFTLSMTPSGKGTDNDTSTMEANFTLTSVPVKSSGFSQMRMNFSGKMRMILEGSRFHSLPASQQSRPRSETFSANLDTFYYMMRNIGLEYTGPFMGLETINRSLNYATATLKCRHILDTTTLPLSPGTLDSCFQATFATFSSPGDRALWTSFLPTKIARIRFRLNAGHVFRNNGNISVESHLTGFEPPSSISIANITADISVFDESNEMRIQVENMTVSSLSPSKPEDDHELYLHSVLDLDPEYEIINSSHFNPINPDLFLPESCELVPKRFARHGHQMESLETPPASPTKSEAPFGFLFDTSHGEESAALPGHSTRASPYPRGLKSPRNTNELQHGSLTPKLSHAIREPQYLSEFQKHLGRVVQQIAHRYPRMNILELTDPNSSLTEHILDGLHGAYLSYTIGGISEGNLPDPLPSLQGNEEVVVKQVNLSIMETGDDQSPGLYDMIILSVSACGEKVSDQISTLRRVRKLIKIGGFLVMVELPRTPVDRQTALRVVSKNGIHHPETPPVTPPDLPDWLAASDNCGFVSTAINADQHNALGFFLSVRQADSGFNPEVFDTRARRRSMVQVIEHLLLIGGQTKETKAVSTNVTSCLARGCKKISAVDNLSDVTAELAAACTAIILLADLEAPVCTSMAASHLEVLNSLMRPGMVTLWVTSNARTDPEKAASFGLTRTLKAETSGLTLQLLDLDGWDHCASRIVEAFCQLASCAATSHCHTSGTLQWSNEPEIHIIDGKRYVPRVLPYTPAIERVNAYRRPISATINTTETCVVLKPTVVADVFVKYEAENVGDVTSHHAESSTSSFMSVEYSTSYPVLIDDFKMYVCIGRIDNEPELLTAALSSELASFVQVHKLLTYDLTTLDLDPPHFAFILAQVLCAHDIVAKTTRKNLVLVEPDQTLLRCVRRTIFETSTEDRISVQVWKCEENSYQEPQALFRHPWSTVREVIEYLPDDCVVHDFLPAEAQLSKTLAALGDYAHYHRGFAVPAVETTVPISGFATSEDLRKRWKQAMGHALEEVAREPACKERPSCITPSKLVGESLSVMLFPIVDWNADRELQVRVKPVRDSRMLDSNRTYVLVGLTRDLGHSLCRLFVSLGARHIVVASRNPDTSPAWVAELNRAGGNIHAERLDVTNLDDVRAFRSELLRKCMPQVGGVVNGAMVLDDRVFAQMDIDTWTRVMRPKTVGSRNLDVVFGGDDLQFFIMTSSFAAIGGHAGQSNYAAANMFMNGLAMNRRKRGLAGSVLNIGVIYGLGLLARERQHVYSDLERDGYPPVSERDLHHMFVEAIEAGRPVPGQVADLTTGLSRYHVDGPKPLHWHRDQRFCHFTVPIDTESRAQNGGRRKMSIEGRVRLASSVDSAAKILEAAMCRKVESILQLPANTVDPDNRMSELGLDSLAAVEIRNWFYKSVGEDVPVMRILAASCISDVCHDVAQSHLSNQLHHDRQCESGLT